MRRIYFLVPDLDSAHKVTEELLLARIEERHIHVIAKEGVELGDLPEATLLQTSDVIPAVERGLAVGGATGLLAGVAAVTFPPRRPRARWRSCAGHRACRFRHGRMDGQHDRRRCQELAHLAIRGSHRAGRDPLSCRCA